MLHYESVLGKANKWSFVLLPLDAQKAMKLLDEGRAARCLNDKDYFFGINSSSGYVNHFPEMRDIKVKLGT